MAAPFVLCILFIATSFYPMKFEDNSGHSNKWWNHVVPDNYTKQTSPSYIDRYILKKDDPPPTRVGAFLVPHLFASISMQTMDFQMEFSLFVHWSDNRLMNPKKYILSPINSYLVLPSEIAQSIWLPALAFVNCKSCETMILNPKEQQFYLNCIHNKTHVGISVRLRKIYRFICHFDMRAYPFDTQECSVVLHALNPDRYVNFKIKSNDAVEEIVVPPEFKLQKISYLNCSEREAHYKYNRKNCHKYAFTFSREIMPHVMLTFIPSMLIVILSWVSFWLDVEVAAPRVALGLTSLLTLATQFNNAQSKLPATNKLKALDIWMFACIFPVFASLLEFAIANYWYRRTKRISTQVTIDEVQKIKDNDPLLPYKLKPRKPKKWQKKMKTAALQMQNKIGKKWRSTITQFHPKLIDQISRVLFPLAFGIFNLIYWISYC